MKVIIAGSRTCNDYDLFLSSIVESGFEIDEVVSGECAGPDGMGEFWAKENNISLKLFPADWSLHGRSAGPRRNSEIVNYVGKDGALILLWDGRSRGSFDILTKAFNAGLEIFVKTVR